MGCDSGVALESSLQIFTVLSASHVTSLLPDISNSAAKIPASASRDPGCTTISAV